MQQPDVETLVAYANGALTPVEARKIEHFLDGNSEARRLIEDYRRTLVLGRVASEAPIRKVPPRHPIDAAQTRKRGQHRSAIPDGLVVQLGDSTGSLADNNCRAGDWPFPVRAG